MSALADRVRARLAARLAEGASTGSTGSTAETAETFEASGTGAGVPPAPAPPRKSRAERRRSPRAILREDVRVLSRASEGGAFAAILADYYVEVRSYAGDRKGRRATKDARLKRLWGAIRELAASLVGHAIPNVRISWSKTHQRPFFRAKKEGEK